MRTAEITRAQKDRSKTKMSKYVKKDPNEYLNLFQKQKPY